MTDYYVGGSFQEIFDDYLLKELVESLPTIIEADKEVDK